MAVPSWIPELAQVADYVTSRTVTQTVGAEQPSGVFSTDTYPTAEQVQRLLESACGWVLAATGTVADSLAETAGDVAALRTAGTVEMSYPERDEDLITAKLLLDQADNALKSLVLANTAATGVSTPVAGANLLPVWQMPDETSSVWQKYGDVNI